MLYYSRTPTQKEKVTLMKTAINQSVTILSLFTLAFGATLAIAWTITSVVYPTQEMDKATFNNKITLHVEREVKQDITRAFKYLIPRLK